VQAAAQILRTFRPHQLMRMDLLEYVGRFWTVRLRRDVLTKSNPTYAPYRVTRLRMRPNIYGPPMSATKVEMPSLSRATRYGEGP